MSDLAIRAVDLTKVYRLYRKPSHRFLDMFGLLRQKPGLYSEHVAVDRLTLEIPRGEKVAIIGRNGAGKSTFLKLVTQVIEPTSGAIEVRGGVHALLQIGTGFHPDFTGRDNALAYLAQLGVTGAAAEEKLAEIVEFTELEEYVDQPLKTYSTGMAVRLMFATSTAITPDILILDEVLSVGDAYFTHKSYERMRGLCEGQGTTLLLVTHDVYSAAALCNRMIWIDRGRVVMDAEAPTVVKAYEDSIREQEERRLRVRKQQQLAASNGSRKGEADHVIVEVRARNNVPQEVPVYFSRIALLAHGAPVDSLPLGPNAFDEAASAHLVGNGSWGDPVLWHGREARPLRNYGSPFHKIAGVFDLGRHAVPPEVGLLTFLFEYWSEKPCDLLLHAFRGGAERDLGPLPAVAGGWAHHAVRWEDGADASSPAGALGHLNTTGVHGTGDIRITNVRFVDDAGNEAYFLVHGKPATLLIDYRIDNPNLDERAQVVVALKRDGVHDVCRFVSRQLRFAATVGPLGTIRLSIPSVALTDGTYSVTAMVAEEGYFDRDQVVFYTINPGVYACLSRVLDIAVVGSEIIGSGTVCIGEGQWSLDDVN